MLTIRGKVPHKPFERFVEHLPSECSMATVYIVDDDVSLSESIANTLTSVGYTTKTFRTPDDFMASSLPCEPSCAVVDLLLPGASGLSLCQDIASRHPFLSFVMITGHGDVSSAVEAMKMGAIDFLEKPFSRERLIRAINDALRAAQLAFDASQQQLEIKTRLSNLTPRERQVFNLVADGQSTREIAERLDISHRTVDVHRSRIMQKLQVESPWQLAQFINRLA